MGVHLALDDFGAGHSGLAALPEWPVDMIKIDKLFVDTITANDSSIAISEALVQMAHRLGLGIIAGLTAAAILVVNCKRPPAIFRRTSSVSPGS